MELEHRQWGRNQRQAAYVAFLSAVTEARTTLDLAYIDKANGKQVSHSDSDAAMSAVEKQTLEAFLVAPAMVAGGVTEMTSALYELSSALRETEKAERWEAAVDKLDSAKFRFISLAKADLGHFTMDKEREQNLRLIRRLLQRKR